jgi:hypothetical protein
MLASLSRSRPNLVVGDLAWRARQKRSLAWRQVSPQWLRPQACQCRAAISPRGKNPARPPSVITVTPSSCNNGGRFDPQLPDVLGRAQLLLDGRPEAVLAPGAESGGAGVAADPEEQEASCRQGCLTLRVPLRGGRRRHPGTTARPLPPRRCRTRRHRSPTSGGLRSRMSLRAWR